jgi:hypothetical protein
MDNAADLAKALPTHRADNPTNDSPKPASGSSRLPAPVLAELWVRMLAIYGYRWESAYGRAPEGVAADTWAAGLTGLQPREIGTGFDACLTSSDGWPPSLPEFRAMCLGIPTLARVKLEARAGCPSPSPFSRLVFSFLDGWAYRQADTEKGERMLRDAYGLARDHVMNGCELPPVAAAEIEHEAQSQRATTPADPEKVKRHLTEIAELLGDKSSPDVDNSEVSNAV